MIYFHKMNKSFIQQQLSFNKKQIQILFETPDRVNIIFIIFRWP